MRGASIGKTRCAGENFCALCGACCMDARGWHLPVERHGLSRVYPPDDYADMQRRGKRILREARKLASSRSMESMRLDYADGNARLNAWYDSQGDVPCGTCTDGPYHGLLREKLL